MGWVVKATSLSLYARERPGTHCTGGWVDWAGRVDQSRPQTYSIPGTVQQETNRYFNYAIPAQCRRLLRQSRPVTCQKVTDGRKRHASTHSRTRRYNGVGGQRHSWATLLTPWTQTRYPLY